MNGMAKSSMRRIGVVLKTSSPEAAELGRQLLVELERLGLEWIIDQESARVLDGSDGVAREDLPGLVDLVVVTARCSRWPAARSRAHRFSASTWAPWAS
jgi:hypothetical protein